MTINSIAWYKGIENSDLEYFEENLKLDFAVAIEKAMIDRDINKSDLASKIATSPAYITKVLRGDANVTIATMAKLSHALDYCVHINLSRKESNAKWFQLIQGSAKAVPKESLMEEVVNTWVHKKYEKQELVSHG